MKMESDMFKFESCFSCQHIILDIGVGKYICDKTGEHISDQKKQFNIYKPTDCNMWKK